MLEELAESYGHLKLAAGHMAGGTAEKLTPTYDRARIATSRGWNTTKGTFSPFYEQVKEGAVHARRGFEVPKQKKKANKRWPALMGLLAAGAAVGAAGAMISRRRKSAAEWDEYEPMPAMEGIGQTGTQSATTTVTAGAAQAAESASAQAGKIAESMHERSSHTRPSESLASPEVDSAAEMASRAPFGETPGAVGEGPEEPLR